MDFIASYIKIKPTVANVLLNDFETRDDDNLLLLKIWDKMTFKLPVGLKRRASMLGKKSL